MLGTTLGPKGSAGNDTKLVPDLRELTEWGGRQMRVECLVPNTLTNVQRKVGGHRST